MNTRWSPLTKGIVIVGGIVATVWVFFRFSRIIPPLIMAIMIAYIIGLPVSWIVRRTGWSRTPIAAVFYLALTVLIVLAPVRVTPMLVDLGRVLTEQVQRLIRSISTWQAEPITLFNFTIPIDELVDQITAAIPTEEIIRRVTQTGVNLVSPLTTGAISFAFSVATTVGWLLFILVVSYYMAKDSQGFNKWFQDRIPPAYRHELGRLSTELSEIWNAFFRGSILVGIIDSILFAALLSIVGMPNSIAWALLAGVFALIPSVGPLIAAVPAILIALIQGSTYLPLTNFWFAFLVAVIYMIVFQIDSYYTVPRIVGDRLKLHPGVVIVGATAGALMGGLLGILLAAPVIASLRVVVGYTYRKLFDLEPFEITATPVGQPPASEIGLISGRPVEAVLFDLDGTLMETDDELVERWAAKMSWLRKVMPEFDTKGTARWLAGVGVATANGIIGLLDRVGLDDETFKLGAKLRHWRGMAPASRFWLAPEINHLIRNLAERYKLGIVTSRGKEEVEGLLVEADLAEVMSVVVTRDSTRRMKPHRQPVQVAAAQLGIDAERCAMVGDTRVDMRSAKSAGAIAVGVLSGFGGRRRLRRADLLLDDVTKLEEWLLGAQQDEDVEGDILSEEA